MNSFLSFLKAEIAREKEVPTGRLLFDRAFGIPLKSFFLIRSEAYAGATAIALDLAAVLTQQQRYVVYCDVSRSVYLARLHGIDTEYFYICHPYGLGLDEFLSLMRELGEVLPDPIIILDNLDILDRTWKLDEKNWKLSTLVKRIRNYLPEATIIGTQREGYVDPVWSYVINIKHKTNIYDDYDGDSKWMGHIIGIEGPKGKSEAYITYETGRSSPAFELAVLEIENGKTANSKFSLDGVEKQGLWRFVHEHSKGLCTR